MEKRRRARINQSLALLKTLILDSTKNDVRIRRTHRLAVNLFLFSTQLSSPDPVSPSNTVRPKQRLISARYGNIEIRDDFISVGDWVCETRARKRYPFFALSRSIAASISFSPD